MPSERFSRFDREMNEWMRSHACREIVGTTLEHTWTLRHGAQLERAALDRAFIYPAHESTSRLTVAWHQAVFDHAGSPATPHGGDWLCWGMPSSDGWVKSPALQIGPQKMESLDYDVIVNIIPMKS
jgi:hypothetical protein